MTTAKQLQANRQNALRSTGPRTPAGKAKVSQNALRHGLSSLLPVLPGESPNDWEAHRDGVLSSLRPAGTLEEALAGRVALCLWRLRRAMAYETASTAVGLDEIEDVARERLGFGAESTDHERLEKLEKEISEKREVVAMWEGTLRLLERLPGLADSERVDPDDAYGALQDAFGEMPESEEEPFDPEDGDFLAGLGVPKDDPDVAFRWPGWTAGMVRQAFGEMADRAGLSAENLLARAVTGRKEIQAKGQAAITDLQRQAKEVRRRIKSRKDRLRIRRMLPAEDTLAKLTRYETHLSRQMFQSLHELQRLQAVRAGEPVPPPAALDVTVEATGEAPANGFVSHNSCSPA
jgi:hypothetical protein